ncbi:PAS domain S-box protein [Halovenus sp. WSH3]|uniref:histidine kinase n=1 Tax=Halovenus carboxidivorans TaxID=2692199 RepID=A0A6B0TAS7_9EURY|nr:PAS domain-containing sensor histidine kinase [Halovenus carboxidivorans]MXR51990.1 PAS domain S-box protein [Halovenus carboxidivorans]
MVADHTPEPAYRALLDTATDPLWVASGDGEFVVVNEAVSELTGYESAELRGNSLTVVFGEGNEQWRHHHQFLRDRGPPETAGWVDKITTKRGVTIPVEVHCRALAVEAGTLVLGRMQDRRGARQQQQKLSILNRVLRHNIRNEMNIILGKASLLQEIDDEGYRTAAEKIEHRSNRIIDISDKVRRAQEHLTVPDDEECALDLVDETEQAVRALSIARPASTIRTSLPSSALALAPPSVDIALRELIENAIVHAEATDPVVEVDMETGDQRVSVHVRDHCPPIPEGVTETIRHGSEHPLRHNDGIGLWIAKWIANSVGGELSFCRRSDDSGNDVVLSFDALDRV